MTPSKVFGIVEEKRTVSEDNPYKETPKQRNKRRPTSESGPYNCKIWWVGRSTSKWRSIGPVEWSARRGGELAERCFGGYLWIERFLLPRWEHCWEFFRLECWGWSRLIRGRSSRRTRPRRKATAAGGYWRQSRTKTSASFRSLRATQLTRVTF